MKASRAALNLSLALSFTTALSLESLAQAQITPDSTLGSEGSTVTPAALVQGELADLVEGGAVRGSNLFHSFLEFNVDAGQRVYFANPAGVESILSRVTGANPSNIFGTLGVDGAADLFLINPNGLVFGETAALDIEGSFYATTAAAIPLGDGVYSATEPAQSSLLTVSPSALFSSYLTQASGDIENRGQLAAQGDLTLAANTLDLQGQVAAGGDLTLLGNAVQIRDGADTPFVGFAGGDLLVQGNERVDIVALSHPDSGLYSYGDMVLRSANPVGGDAHYFSGGSFRVENLDESLGELFSPIDPVIRALGDVAIFGYRGGSLHILAGGSINVGTAIITDADPGELGVDFLQETITLSDGTVVAIDGGAQPTLDVRAGVAPAAIGVIPPGNITGLDPAFILLGLDSTNAPIKINADITVGDVFMDAPNGLVLLTNQYEPNRELPNGNLSIGADGLFGIGINAINLTGAGGSVYLDVRGDLSLVNGQINTTSLGLVGDIVVLADGTVTFDGTDGSRPTGAYSNLAPGGTGSAGDVRITAGSVEMLNEAQLDASTYGEGGAGNVVIQARDSIVFDGTSVAVSRVEEEALGAGGNVVITTGSLAVTNGAQLVANTRGTGNAGSVVVQARDRVAFDGRSADGLFSSAALSTVAVGAIGTGGQVAITTGSLDVTNGAQLSSSTASTGNAGDVVIQARDRVIVDGRSIDGRFSSAVSSSVETGAVGAGGKVEIITGSLEVTNGAGLTTGTSSTGNAGNVVIRARDRVSFDNARALSSVAERASGLGGNVVITTGSLEVTSGAQLIASTFGTGDAGNVVIQADDRVVFDGTSADGQFISAAGSSVEAGATGAGGNVEIAANSLEVTNGAQLNASTRGNGDAGNVVIQASDTIVFDNSAALSSVAAGAVGAGGNVEITTGSLDVVNGALLISVTFGNGDAGNVVIQARDTVVFNNASGGLSSVATRAVGAGGNVEITTGSLAVTNRSSVSSGTLGNGDSGSVVIQARDTVVFDNSTAGSTVQAGATGAGGNVEISTNSLAVTNGAELTARTGGNGDAGNVIIQARGTVVFDGTSADGQFGSNARSDVAPGATGAGGNVEIAANSLAVLNGAQLNASTRGSGDAGNVVINVDGRIRVINGTISSLALATSGGRIDIRAGNLILRENSNIVTLVAVGEGSGGNITIIADFIIALDDSDILAFSADGQGGDIDLSRTTFFGQNANIGFGSLTREELLALDGNARVDINASGGVEAGQIAIGDSSFIENSLTSLADTIVDTSALTAGSCIARSDESLGSFVATGSGGLPQRPGDSTLSTYPTGTVRAETAPTAAVQEPDGVYQLSDGRLVLSRTCE